MARHFPSGIDFHAGSILNALLNPLSSDPGGLGAGDEGRVWYNTTTDTLKFWTGSVAIDTLARANHTGTQLASTISDFNTAVRLSTLNQMAAPTADLSIASHKLTNVTDGTGAQDAATKGQLDAAIASLTSGLVLKGAVVCAATSNVSITSAPSTIDGITMSNGMIVLLTAQTTTTQAGPYVWASAGAAMARADNWNSDPEAVLGSFWIVEQGTNADNIAVCTNDTAITLGTTTPLFAFRGAGVTYTQGNGISISGGVISAVQNTGVIVNGSGIGVDFSVVGRKVVGVIPTTTGGIFTVSGATITVNHALSNWAAQLTLRAYTSPDTGRGFAAGQLVECDDVAADANNITLTLPATPSTNNWYVSVIG
jgi:hypothetical protein